MVEEINDDLVLIIDTLKKNESYQEDKAKLTFLTEDKIGVVVEKTIMYLLNDKRTGTYETTARVVMYTLEQFINTENSLVEFFAENDITDVEQMVAVYNVVKSVMIHTMNVKRNLYMFACDVFVKANEAKEDETKG